MIIRVDKSLKTQSRASERGAALATAILMLALLSVIALSVLSVVQVETRVAGSDLEKTQAFYAAAAGIEKMTSDFSTLFARTSRPTTTQLTNIAGSPPDLASEGFSFNQNIALDDATLTAMRATQGISGTAYPSVTVQNGPLAGLTASVAPYTLTTVATSASAQVELNRTMNNYLVPIFQFGMFSSEDMEIHPGPNFTFNGRVHANGNLYLNGNVTFLDKVTTASEVVRDVLRNGATHDGTVHFDTGPLPIAGASVLLGPNVNGSAPNSPTGTVNSTWKSTSVATYNGQLLSKSTGIAPLLLPLQLDGNQTREIIKRRMPNDDQTLSESRYHSKAEVRILIDDEQSSASDASGIPTGKGVKLSVTNTGDTYYFKPDRLNSGKALWRMNDSGTYLDTSSTAVLQGTSGSVADTVRNIRNPSTPDTSTSGRKIPGGSGIPARIYIEIIDSNGNSYDVTRPILSMGMTEGEPNAIVILQRPLWAAYLQGSRDSSGSSNPAFNGDPAYTNCLTDILNKTRIGADGEIKTSGGSPAQDTTHGFITSVLDDTASGSQPQRSDSPAAAGSWNSIVPINVYNVREGHIHSSLANNSIFERGMTSIVELNMKNVARWLDGVYDSNLLSGTSAVSSNIGKPDGYIIYVSDRRGDKIKSEVDSAGVTLSTTNGMVDNEDIYGPIVTSGYVAALDPGEDVIDNGTKKNTLQRDLTELPDPLSSILSSTTASTIAERTARANAIAAWTNIDSTDTASPKTKSKYFRRAVRLFNGENLQVLGGTNKLSTTLGITVASENMVYIWGNYNTTGINAAPPAGQSCLNDVTAACYYTGNQVPASIVCDAFFPLSKTWFDSMSSMFPDDVGDRPGDRSLPGVTAETSLRAGIIAGNNLSAMSATSAGPDAGNYSSDPNNNESRLNGGMHNFPRFLESWSGRYNLVGSLIPLYHSTQAMGQYNTSGEIYSPPERDWAFDATFKSPDRLPPGTPQFQYIEPTAFRQVMY
ncbi:MAG TPA: PilX N-terminal domain-containing pilus assembly protein [Pyrinomonadaceae bacterium]|nr:PilX N-terminal domain-containing pilus assembly protein [Pyrinomonadaceae bacterium]